MNIEGAIVNEQNITFGIIVVKPHVLSSPHEADKARKAFQGSLAEFSSMPLILACQKANGSFSYQGRQDIVNFLASIDASRIKWKRYTYA
jgi:hypothetical protein